MRIPVTFERLEDRLALANVFWNVDADGFWDVASNWRDEFGASRLPEIGRGIGKGIRNFKNATKEEAEGTEKS